MKRDQIDRDPFREAERALLGQRWTFDQAGELKHLVDIGAACGGEREDMRPGHFEETAGALTPHEREVMTSLVEAWNGFLRLPIEHPDQVSEFRRAIHVAQDMIMARPGWRAFNRGG